MISRLTLGAYDTVATMIQKTEPLVSFNKSCSQHVLEEKRRNKHATPTPQAMINLKMTDSSSDNISPSSDNNNTGNTS